jgi:hypothetical protein
LVKQWVIQQCLRGRWLDNIEELRAEVEARCEERNRLSAGIDWRFTTPDARIKLRKLYPSIELDRGLASSKPDSSRYGGYSLPWRFIADSFGIHRNLFS